MTDGRAHEGSEFVRHIPCPACGSSDANGLYTDGHSFCFSCGAREASGGEGAVTAKPRAKGLLEVEPIAGLSSRGLTAATLKKFGYGQATYNGQPAQVAGYYDTDGRLVAQKVRLPGKDFGWIGAAKQSQVLPFGAHVWPRTGKKIIVTEGEMDALSYSQVQGNKWPVVSIPTGAGPQVKKYIAHQLDYFNGFEEVLLAFDQDEPGREAAQAAAEVLGGRAKLITLPLKDANEMLVAGRADELVQAMWQAKPYSPDGIVTFGELKEAILQKPQRGLSYQLETLDNLLYGKRLGELVTIGAGTGVGKTDFLLQDTEHMLRVHGEKVGLFFLEQLPSETALRMVGKHVKTPLHIPDYWDEDLFEEGWKRMQDSGLFLFDSFGRNDWSVIKKRITFLHHAHDVKYFVLDHVTALAAAIDSDERKALDAIMAEMGALVKELNIHLMVVSHLATPEGKPHEEGGRVMIRHFRGSRALGFWSSAMVALERNQQATSEELRHTTAIRILKDRFTGQATGKVFHVRYLPESGYMVECPPPADGEEHGFKDEMEGDESAPDF